MLALLTESGELEDRMEELACLFGVALGEQLHGALKIGVQDCSLETPD